MKDPDNIIWYDLSLDAYWLIDLYDFKVGDKTAQKSSTIYAILDTGSSYLILHYVDFMAMAALLQAADSRLTCNYPSDVNSYQC